MSTIDLLYNINKEDKSVPGLVELQIPKVERLVDSIVPRMKLEGVFFILGQAPW